MKTSLRIASLSLFAGLVLAALPAAAGTLYNNGPVNGFANGQDIKRGTGNSVSDSFTLTASQSTLTGFHFGEWNEVEARPSKVTWAIGSTPFSTTYTGTATVDSGWTHLFYNQNCCDVYDVAVTLPNISLPNGTYWLTLSNGVGCGPFGCDGVVKWDENSGVGCSSFGCASQAYFDNTLHPINSESFYIQGTNTPEPGTLVMLASGVLGVGGFLRRRLIG